MHALAVIALALSLLVPQVARAQTPVLVELFTSQGCSSCPPADALLGDLAKREGVVALAFHVDYWDYLGWKDTFASNAYTQRQLSYAPQVDRSHINQRFRGSFTPEVVVQGRDSLIGSDTLGIASRIVAHQEQPAGATIALSRDGATLTIRLTPGAAAGQVATIRVAEYRTTAEVDIRRGENANRVLTYHHVVTEFSDAGRWDGTEPAEIQVPEVEGPVAVFLQRGNTGRVLAAATLTE